MISSRQPNVIFLSIDSLRYDRIGCYGYKVAHSPVLDSFFNSAVSFSNTYSHGSPTQFSFPAIMSGTMPLDYSGYDFGISDRPDTLAEVFQKAGYWTMGLSCGGSLSSFYGYDRGFDTFHHMQDVSVFLNSLWKSYIQHFLNSYTENFISESECIEKITPVLLKGIISAMEMCKEKQGELENKFISMSPYIHNKNYSFLHKFLEVQKKEINSSPKSYFRENILKKPPNEIFSPFWPKQNSKIFLLKKIFNREFLKYGLEYRTNIRVYDGERIINTICQYIDGHKNNPFFIWANIFDVHDRRWSSGPFVHPPVSKQIFKNIKREGNSYIGFAPYDYAVSYVDSQIGRLISYLEKSKLIENTVIVLTSDHGWTANWPRPNVSHVGNFFDEFVKVPLGISHPDLPARRVDTLTGLIDLPSMLLGVAGLDVPTSFQGRKGIDGPARPYIAMENMGRGPCDFSSKPIRVAYRTKTQKFIYSEDMKRHDGTCILQEAYDLGKDSLEFDDLVQQTAEITGEETYRHMAEQRCRDIRARLVGAPDDGQKVGDS